MKRFSFVFIPALSAALLSLTGCDQSSGTKVCVDQNNRRVDDGQCNRPYHSWYYFGRGSSVPSMGDVARGGSVTPTPGESYTIKRGGFGGLGAHFGGFSE